MNGIHVPRASSRQREVHLNRVRGAIKRPKPSKNNNNVAKCVTHSSSHQSQTVTMIRLSQEEVAWYRDVPVVMDISTWFYIFPVRAHAPFKSLERTSG